MSFMREENRVDSLRVEEIDGIEAVEGTTDESGEAS